MHHPGASGTRSHPNAHVRTRQHQDSSGGRLVRHRSCARPASARINAGATGNAVGTHHYLAVVIILDFHHHHHHHHHATNLPAVAVDFLPDDVDDDDNGYSNDTNAMSFASESSFLQSMDSTEWNNSSDTSTGMTTDSSSATALSRGNTVDPLQQMAHIFSSWHYQPPANVSDSVSGSSANSKGKGNTSSTSASVSMDDIKRSRLEYAIAELQFNLKNPNCLRSVDDMVDELNGYKAELSCLKWDKWVSWR
jgi:hypothetical protein